MTQTPKEGYCEWTEHEGQPSYTECGHGFEFNEDGIRENKFVFCPYCGGNISIADSQNELLPETDADFFASIS